MKSLLISLVLITGCGSGGPAGPAGQNGKDSTPGKDGVAGKDGTPGKDGVAGKDGKDGKDAQSILDKVQATYLTHRQSVYRITVQCGGLAKSFGTGFRISAVQVATSAHVTSYVCSSGAKRFKIDAVWDYLDTIKGSTMNGNGDCPVESSSYCVTSSSVLTSSSDDLSKISVPSTLKGKAVTFAASTSKSVTTVGYPLMTMSFPLGFEDLYTVTGTISSNYLGECYGGSGYGCPGLSYDFISSLDTDHGSSGSPIFDLMTGEVIGVTTAGTEGENMNATWGIFSQKLNNF